MKSVISIVTGVACTLLAACSSMSGGYSVTSSSSSIPAASSPASTSSSTPAPSSSATPTPTPTPSGPTELTVEEASTTYLAFVCPSNKAQDKYLKARFKYDFYTPSDQPPNDKTRKAAQVAADADETAAKALADPQLLWPKNVRADVQDVATQLYESSAWYSRIAEAKTWSQVPHYPKVKNRDAASAVRLALGLPPRGECPKKYGG